MGCCEAKPTSGFRDRTTESQNKGQVGQIIERVPLRCTITAFPKVSVYSIRLDGGKIYAAGEADWIGIWELKSSLKVRELRGHTNKVYCLSVENDTVVSGSEDMTVKVWDGPSGKCTKTCTGHTAQVLCVLYTGDRVFSGSQDKTVIEWDLDKHPDIGIKRRSFTEHSAPVFALQFLAPSTLITGSMDTTVKWWDLNGRLDESVQTNLSHKGSVLCLEASGSFGGGHLATGGGKNDMSLKIWNLDKTAAELKATMQGHQASIRCLVHVSASKVVTGSADGSIREWDLNTWSQTRVLVENGTVIYSMQYEEGALITASADGEIKVYDLV